MPVAQTLMLVLLPVLLAASAFFSGSETALFSLSAQSRKRLARSGSIAGHALSSLLSDTRSLLVTLLLGNMTINVLFFVTSSVLLVNLGREDLLGPIALALASVVPLLAIILLGEVLPKLLAARLTELWCRVVAIPMFGFHRTITPIRLVATGVVITPLARLIAPANRPPELSVQELESLLNLSKWHGVIDIDEERLLQQALALNQLKVRDLMVPRVDVQAFDLDDEPAQLLSLIQQTKLRHIPAFRGDLDHIEGLIFARQALLDPPTTREQVQKLVRQVRFIPEQQRADRALLELRRSGTNLAIVVDEYGGTAGLVTIEDVVEHLVGDIPGDYEQQGEPELERVGPNVWSVSGELSVYQWADVFGRNRAVEGLTALEAVSTVGGLVMAALGRVPGVGDHVDLGNVRITVREMAGSRIMRVSIELFTRASDAGEPRGEDGGAGS